MSTQSRNLATVLAVMAVAATVSRPAIAQAPPPAPEIPRGAVVRRIVMKDAASAEQFRQKLDTLKGSGLFRDQLPGMDPKKPIPIEISFLVSGNYLLMIGSQEWVDRNLESVRLMAFLFERPRSHLQLNLRVVQLTGPANSDVIQMSETVRALVDAQREEIVRTFADLQDYLVSRARARQGSERALQDAVQELFPGIGTGERPLSVPETLMMLMLDRTSPTPSSLAARESTQEAQAILLSFPNTLARVAADPQPVLTPEVRAEMDGWKRVVTAARDWCKGYADNFHKDRDGTTLDAFREALGQAHSPIPMWLGRRLRRSLDLTERLYPNLVRKHTESSLREMERRFALTLEKAAAVEKSLGMDGAPAAAQADGMAQTHGSAWVTHQLLVLKTLSEGLIPAPLALFDAVATSADNAAPTPEQLLGMFKEYSEQRRRLDDPAVGDGLPLSPEINYARLLSLESTLNLWMRRVSEGMARALEQQFYRRYVNELRVMANRQLGKTSNRDILTEASIDEVPDVARDLLLADAGVNIFVSNSISLQFSPETTNSVSANVQAALPSKTSITERIQEAQRAAGALQQLSSSFGINGESIVKALLAGGQAVPVQSGIDLSAMPTIGFDGSTVSLTLTANQTLQPNSDRVADRVTNHNIRNATITALAYEPMVLSTLVSNISYYENTGGIPVLRKAPILKDLLKDIPLAPFKEGKRQKGVFQSSVIILEPVVIPSIEDLVRYHSGWRERSTAPKITVNPN